MNCEHCGQPRRIDGPERQVLDTESAHLLSAESDTALLAHRLTEIESALGRRLDGLHERVLEAESQSSGLQSRFQSLDRAVIDETEVIDMLQERLTAQELRADDRVGKIEQHSEQLADRVTHDDLILSERIAVLSTRLLSAERTIAALTDNMLVWQRRVQVQGDSLSNLESRFRSLDNVVLEEISERRALDEAQGSLATDLANLSAQMSEVLGRLDTVDERQAVFHPTIREIERQVDDRFHELQSGSITDILRRLDGLESAQPAEISDELAAELGAVAGEGEP